MGRYRTEASVSRLLLLGLVILVFANGSVPARADSDSEGKGDPATQANPQKEQERAQVGVEMRWRFEARDNADLKPASDLDGFLGQRIRASLRLRIVPHLSAYVEGQDVWLFDADNDKVIHDLATNLHQAYLDWKPGGSQHWELRAGRQEFIYGEERLVGAFGWDNVGRSFDAARLRYRVGAWSSDFIGGREVDVRRAGRPARRGAQSLSGFYLTRAPAGSAGQTEFYGLFLRDGLRTPGELAGQAGQTIRIATFGFRRVYQPSTGWQYMIEHGWQFGQRGPDPHRAAMLVTRGGYRWAGRFQPRLAVEYDWGSGDGDPRDGKSREFHNLFPTNHPHYGYADLLGLRNMHALRLTAAARLHKWLTLEADYHRFWLASRRGPWKNAGGRILGFDPSGQVGRDLGQELDLTFRLPLQEHLKLLAGYSVFWPGQFAARTRGSQTQHFAYVQTLAVF